MTFPELPFTKASDLTLKISPWFISSSSVIFWYVTSTPPLMCLKQSTFVVGTQADIRGPEYCCQESG